jgi:hypothetical protein
MRTNLSLQSNIGLLLVAGVDWLAALLFICNILLSYELLDAVNEHVRTFCTDSEASGGL